MRFGWRNKFFLFHLGLTVLVVWRNLTSLKVILSVIVTLK